MNDKTLNLLYEIQSYFPFHKIRNDNGGGEALLIKDNLVSEKLNLPLSLKEEELVGAELKIGGKLYNIFCFYNPPPKGYKQTSLRARRRRIGNFLILGDLNCKIRELDGSDNRNGIRLKEIINKSRSFILNKKDKSTFFRKTNESWYKSTLDLLIAPETLERAKIRIEVLDISAVTKHQEKNFHVPITVELMINYAKNKSYLISCPSFISSRANWTEFQMELDRELIVLDPKDAPLEIIASEIKNAQIKAAKYRKKEIITYQHT